MGGPHLHGEAPVGRTAGHERNHSERRGGADAGADAYACGGGGGQSEEEDI